MKVESLKELESAFAKWRRGKKYVREAVPEELLVRARRAAERHGVAAVVRATRVDGPRLLRHRRGSVSRERERAAGAPRTHSTKERASTVSEPTFTRLELSAPVRESTGAQRPLAEVHTSGGATLRVFEESPGMMALLSQACGLGGAR